jgi:hypothetical protein
MSANSANPTSWRLSSPTSRRDQQTSRRSASTPHVSKPQPEQIYGIARDGSLGFAHQLMFRTRGPDLSAIAADAHFAPAAATVLGGVEEQPTALHASASLGARQLFFHEQGQRRKRNGPEDCPLHVPAWIPGPDVGTITHFHLGEAEALCVRGCQRSPQLLRDWPLLCKGCSDRPDKLSDLEYLLEYYASELRALGNGRPYVGAVGRCHDAGVFDPLHDGIEVSEVFLMREETTAGRRICEIQRKLAADEIEAAGAGRQREWLRFTSTSHM